MVGLPEPSSPAGALRVLLVDDDAADAMLVQEAFADRGYAYALSLATDGVEAMALLEDLSRPLPHLVVLDLNMPRMDGRQVLAAMKADERLRQIPVVVLTTTSAPGEILRAYGSHANAFVTKPLDLDAFTHAVHRIDDFFLRLARLPHP